MHQKIVGQASEKLRPALRQEQPAYKRVDSEDEGPSPDDTIVPFAAAPEKRVPLGSPPDSQAKANLSIIRNHIYRRLGSPINPRGTSAMNTLN